MIKKNAIANYVSQGYLSVVNIAVIPYFIRELGPEAFGFIGLFVMLQGWLQVLDVGLSPTLSREAAKSKIDNDSAEFFLKFRFLVFIFFLFCIICLISLYMTYFDSISTSWLQTSYDPEFVSLMLTLMFISVCFRWCSGPWRSCLVGLEKQVILSYINIAIGTLRYPAALLIVIISSSKLISYFYYQIFVSILEFFILFIFATKFSPPTNSSMFPTKSFFKKAKPSLKFAMSIAFTASIWAVITQSDKLILSNYISMEKYGLFSSALVLASGVVIMSTPISQAILPKLIQYHSLGNTDSFKELYFKSTQFVVACIWGSAWFIFYYSEEIMFFWTGDYDSARETKDILRWYSLGNGFLAVSSLVYYLQSAKGDLTLHVKCNIFLLVLLLPSIYWTAKNFGGVGTAKLWFMFNLIYFIFWTKIVHDRFFTNLHRQWVSRCILPFMMTFVLIVFFMDTFLVDVDGLFSFVVSAIITFFTSLTLSFYFSNTWFKTSME